MAGVSTHREGGVRPVATMIRGAVAVALATVLISCGNDGDVGSRSIEEIQRDEGIPIEVRRLDAGSFSTYLEFTATVNGAVESTASALLSDEVAEVRFAVGDLVERGDTVVTFPTDNPSLNYDQARIAFESARTAFERVQSLYEGDGISRQSYDDARTQFDIAAANWETVQSMIRVEAPISGYITRLNVLESDNVNPGNPLFTVADPSRLKATVWLTDRQVRDVAVGQRAVARWEEEEIYGEIVQVDMAMDQSRRAFAAKVRFDNGDLRIPSGVTATVQVVTFRDENALVVNRREILEGQDGPYVFVTDGLQALRRPVTILRNQGLLVQVDLDLNPDERLITRGIEQVGDGLRVRIVGEPVTVS